MNEVETDYSAESRQSNISALINSPQPGGALGEMGTPGEDAAVETTPDLPDFKAQTEGAPLENLALTSHILVFEGIVDRLEGIAATLADLAMGIRPSIKTMDFLAAAADDHATEARDWLEAALSIIRTERAS